MKHNYKKKGYTLIEVLIVLTVITIISGVVLANYHEAGQRSEIVMSARQLATSIRQVENYALSGKQHYCLSGDCPWVIQFTPLSNTYTIYHDNNDDLIFAAEELYDTMEMPPGVFLNSITSDMGIEGVSYLSFLEPDPEILICEGLLCDRSWFIFEVSNGVNTMNVHFNKFGLVDIQ